MKIKLTYKHLVVLVALIFSGNLVIAQSLSPMDATLTYLENNKSELGLSTDDFSDWIITDQYKSKHNGVTHTYIIQRHNGIKIHNAMINSNIGPKGNMLYMGNRFIPNKASKVTTTKASLTSLDAIQKVGAEVGANIPTNLTVKKVFSENKITYNKNNIALEPITTELVYQLKKDGNLALAWDVFFYQNGQHAWSIRVDANTGDILEKQDHVIKCKFHEPEHDLCSKHDQAHRPSIGANFENFSKNAVAKSSKTQKLGDFGADTYFVVAPPAESPDHAPHSLVTAPANATASPQGWHSNGAQNFTITRGNNVHAYQDRDGNDASAGDEPDGGATLDFNFPFNPADEPTVYSDAAVTNLFFWCNYFHDVFYMYGFDEAGGNFQQNNFGLGGAGNDFVIAEAQDAADNAVRNNANFSTPPDGGSGRMQMYMWDKSASSKPVFEVTAPAGIAGPYFASLTTDGNTPPMQWAPIPLTAVIGELELVDDMVGTPSDGCETNSVSAGKVALIDRGSCEFGVKILNAEQGGAIAAIVCNNIPGGGLVNMAPGAVGLQVTIPGLFLSLETCNILKTEMANGPVTVKFQDLNIGGPNDYDSDLDNGIIAHEFGHGLSNRLTGGPSNTGCLNNDEQAGEGWSDLVALYLTVEPGDAGTDARGIGTYVERAAPNGAGIRRWPYSTDMTVNPQDYDDIRGQGVHGTGEIMCDVMWDLYWDLVAVYGWDADIYAGTGGNNTAFQLLIDGLKMQPCSPGFLDFKDAVLAADVANNNSANQCLIHKTFARRGLGIDADQGVSTSRDDGTPGFNPPPDCIEELKITKTATPNADVADPIVYTIKIINDKPADVTGTVVTDQIPFGTTYIPNSATMGGTVSGNMVTWNIGTITANDEITLEFQVDPSDNAFSWIHEQDGFENGTGNWVISNDAALTNVNFALDSGNPASGGFAMYAGNPATESDQYLQTLNFYDLTGTRPALVFDHAYDTERGFDGGLVEFMDINLNANNLMNDLVRNPYPDLITNQILTPGNGAFSGNSGGYVESIIDFSNSLFNGQSGFFRFRAISDANTGGNGWLIDNFKFMNLYSVPGHDACITTTEGDNVCAQTPDIGTVIYGYSITNNEDVQPNYQVQVYPNPAQDVVTIDLAGQVNGAVEISLLSVDGKVIRTINNGSYDGPVTMNLGEVAAGMYLARVKTDDGTITKKVVVQK